MMTEADLRLLGRYGANFYNNTTARTGNWTGIQAITACTFTLLTASNSDALAGITLAAGDIVILPFTAITLATGSLLAFKEPAL